MSDDISWEEYQEEIDRILRESPKRPHIEWTERERAIVMSCYESVPIETLAKELKRTKASIQSFYQRNK